VLSAGAPGTIRTSDPQICSLVSLPSSVSSGLTRAASVMPTPGQAPCARSPTIGRFARPPHRTQARKQPPSRRTALRQSFVTPILVCSPGVAPKRLENLSQHRHRFKLLIYLVQLGGLEPPTSCSTDRRSNQLSYNCIPRRAPLKGGRRTGRKLGATPGFGKTKTAPNTGPGQERTMPFRSR
jgi:hypothetical protein